MKTEKGMIIAEALYQGRNAYLAGNHSSDGRYQVWKAICSKGNTPARLFDLGWTVMVDAYWAATGTCPDAEAAVEKWTVEAESIDLDS